MCCVSLQDNIADRDCRRIRRPQEFRFRPMFALSTRKIGSNWKVPTLLRMFGGRCISMLLETLSSSNSAIPQLLLLIIINIKIIKIIIFIILISFFIYVQMSSNKSPKCLWTMWPLGHQPRLSLWAQYHTGRGFFRAEDGPVDHQSGGRLPCHCLCLWANRTSMGLYTKHRNNACHQSFQDFSRPSQQLTMSYSSSASLTPGSGKTHTMEGYRYRAQADTPQVGSCTLMGFRL